MRFAQEEPALKLFRAGPHATVKLWFISSAVWFFVGTIEGMIDATHLAAPDLLGNIPFIVFSRVRPMHTNTMIYGFAGSGLIGGALYLLPTLVRAPLFSERLGVATAWLWNLVILSGTVTLGVELSQGREYAEWIWPVDVGAMLVFGLVFTNLLMTTLRRREPVLYVSNWYIFAALVFMSGIYFFGNAMWNPATGAVRGGIADGSLAWFYGHGIVGLFLTPLSVAIAYYVIPNVVRSPLYSHTLSMVGFWTILMIYNHIGGHHLLQTPAPTWVKVLAITGSIAMIVPVFTVLINLWLTMRGRLGAIHADIGGKFIMAGLVWYILTCLQGPLQSLPGVQRMTHLNNWVIAHSHMGVFGFAGIIAIGGIYYILPRIAGRPVHNPRLADVQYWLAQLGMSGFFVVLTAGGLVQGNAWLNGETVYRTLAQLHPYMVIRAGLGVLLVGAAGIGVYNVAMTLYGRRREGVVP
jgi:cytochrome c oxidase cbb3-type subunit 1/cytochrome c oxidase cbb3-type subunit I/II